MRRFALVLTVAWLCAGSLSAQIASYILRSQVPVSNDPVPPFLNPLSLPRLGQPFQLDVPATRTSVVPNGQAVYLLMTGLAPAAQDLTPLSGPGLTFRGILYTTTDSVVITPTVQSTPGRTIVAVSIPNDTGLLGFRFYQQVAEILLPGPSGGIDVRVGRGGIGLIGT